YRVRAHRIGLLQVLGNLILNAYESIERDKKLKGHIALSALDTVVDDKPMVRLTVRDNGTGFDEDMGRCLFQRGYSSKSKGSATGLGLHWCANAVAGMGGRISAESLGAGQGAEFHVLLPAAQGG
ncbi:MAG: ATP-binding protein, partial [Gammaproteobacteria bacterium]|nr:ATP-binding protein [Gammaproteobacteria bacterium]